MILPLNILLNVLLKIILLIMLPLNIIFSLLSVSSPVQSAAQPPPPQQQPPIVAQQPPPRQQRQQPPLVAQSPPPPQQQPPLVAQPPPLRPQQQPLVAFRPIRVNKSLLPANLASLHEKRWRVHHRREEIVAMPENEGDYVIEEIPREMESESATAFKAAIRVTIYGILVLLGLFLLWRTDCCLYPIKVCCWAVCSRICCCCCSCCNPKEMGRKMAVSAVNKYAVGVNITKDGEVTMREVEREELEAVKNLAMTALDIAKPV